MVDIKKDLLYSKSHEWVKKMDDTDTTIIGISDFAQDSLGDIVYVEFLVGEGDSISKGDQFSEVESVKAVESTYIPISGTIIQTNSSLDADYSVINDDPYVGGWLIKLKLKDESELSELMNSDQYSKFLEENK